MKDLSVVCHLVLVRVKYTVPSPGNVLRRDELEEVAVANELVSLEHIAIQRVLLKIKKLIWKKIYPKKRFIPCQGKMHQRRSRGFRAQP